MTSDKDRDMTNAGPAEPGVQAGHDGESRRNDVLTIVEEQARVSVVRQDAGGLRVRVVTEDAATFQPVALEAEQVEIERHPVGREIETVPDVRKEGDVTIIPVVEERAVVVTRLFLVEEIHLRRTRRTETVEVPVTLRRQRAVVEQLEPEAADPDPAAGQAGLPDPKP